MIRYASLFSGVGGLGMGFDAPDYECVLLCEIDKQARSVLQRHYPNTPIIPDVKDVHIEPGTIDLLIGGPPCQDYSVAGRRGGLAGDRGAMWWEFHRVASEARPSIVAIENVPGLLSSDEGRCFGTIIQSLVNLGYCVSWRVCNAQYWGVAQRRRRLFIVGSLGNGRCAQILFEPDCLQRDFETRRESGQVIATLAASGAGTSRPAGQGNELDFLIAGSLGAHNAGSKNIVGSGAFIPQASSVRRLTPGECELLQGWPTDWTRYGHDGREMADGPRYRMCGNGVVGNVSRWLAERILINRTAPGGFNSEGQTDTNDQILPRTGEQI